MQNSKAGDSNFFLGTCDGGWLHTSNVICFANDFAGGGGDSRGSGSAGGAGGAGGAGRSSFASKTKRS